MIRVCPHHGFYPPEPIQYYCFTSAKLVELGKNNHSSEHIRTQGAHAPDRRTDQERVRRPHSTSTHDHQGAESGVSDLRSESSDSGLRKRPRGASSTQQPVRSPAKQGSGAGGLTSVARRGLDLRPVLVVICPESPWTGKICSSWRNVLPVRATSNGCHTRCAPSGVDSRA